MASQIKLPPFAAGVFLLSSLLLGGCANSSLLDARAEVPAPHKIGAYPAVHDLPAKPRVSMTPEERSKLSQELNAALRQAAAAKAQGGPPNPTMR